MKNRIGIVGGGQLARMLIFEAKKMGFMVTVLDPTPQSPGGQVADKQIIASLNDFEAMQELAKNSDYITFDWELADANLLEQLEKEGITVHPSSATLRMIQDKLIQKEFLQKNNIPVARFKSVETKEDIYKIGKDFGYPMLLKTRFGGYDGKGNTVLKDEKQIDYAIDILKGKPLYVEKFVPFIKEISVIIARSISGEIQIYPVAENIHRNNILHTTIAPARINTSLKKKAEKLARDVMQYLQGAGVFGIEMFITKTGKVLVNEIAPRVHNSGHYTIEACLTSQFEQHVRAVTGLPLGRPAMIVPNAVMVNILGDRNGKPVVTGMNEALRIPGVNVHLYGKSETKPERKMGHLTALGNNLNETMRNAKKARNFINV